MSFETHVARRAEEALRSVPPDERRDCYVVSFYVYDVDDDPRTPTLTVGTNTESEVGRRLDPRTKNRFGNPSDTAEARWNYAFWLQNQLAMIADPDGDPRGAELCEQWIRTRGLWLEEPDDWTDRLVVTQYEGAAGLMTSAFVELCVDTAQLMHRSGVVVDVFGGPIPIVVHELEYYDEIAAQTERANPPGLAGEFVEWINAMGA